MNNLIQRLMDFDGAFEYYKNKNRALCTVSYILVIRF